LPLEARQFSTAWPNSRECAPEPANKAAVTTPADNKAKELREHLMVFTWF